MIDAVDINAPDGFELYKNKCLFPDLACVYSVSIDNECIYVGSTLNLNNRWRNHSEMKKNMTPDACISYWLVHPMDLYEAEMLLYRFYLPVFNKVPPRIGNSVQKYFLSIGAIREYYRYRDAICKLHKHQYGSS